MASDDKDLIDQGMRSLTEGDDADISAEMSAMKALAARVEEPGLQDKILERYTCSSSQMVARPSMQRA